MNNVWTVVTDVGTAAVNVGMAAVDVGTTAVDVGTNVVDVRMAATDEGTAANKESIPGSTNKHAGNGLICSKFLLVLGGVGMRLGEENVAGRMQLFIVAMRSFLSSDRILFNSVRDTTFFLNVRSESNT